MARTRDNVAVSMGAADDHGYEESTKSGMTLLVVIFSLVFVAVFGGALVGGIVSGDPDGTFFTIIIVTSTMAIAVAVIFGIQKVYCKKSKDRDMDKRNDLRGTFTRSEEENHHYDEDPRYDGHYEEHYEPRPTPVNARINEIKAGSVAGDMSALSPTTLEMETDTRTRGNRSGRTPRRESSGGPFDFANVSVASERRNGPRREDPPESSDAPSYTESFKNQRLMDPPTGLIDSGHFLKEEMRDDNEEEDEEEVADAISSSSHHTRRLSSSSHHTSTSRYLVDEDNYEEFGGDEGKPKSPAKKSSKHQTLRRDVSISRSRHVIMPFPTSHLSFLDSQVPPPPPPPPPRIEPPLSTRSSMSKISKPPATPMSEAGSAVSSLFLKPFSAVFGKKRAASEASVSETSSYEKGSKAGSGYYTHGPKASREKSKKSNGSEVGVSSKIPMGADRPPKPGRKPSSSQSDVGESKSLETINAGASAPTKRGRLEYETEIGRYAPATPTGSTFSRGAASSIAPSEFRSTAGSSVFSTGVASSTFDPQVHQAALKRQQRNSAIIGAQRVNDDPEVFFEEDEEESDIETGTAYDVFAPQGPIGIVVDTTEAGPIVHSLKKSSPMQGLIRPGDLILALDGKDVRRMNAATLTKLMAKKSRQTERKFTLMASEDYEP